MTETPQETPDAEPQPEPPDEPVTEPDVEGEPSSGDDFEEAPNVDGHTPASGG